MTARDRAILEKIALKDAALFRNQCYVNGEWIDADAGGTFDVFDPGTGALIASGSELRCDRDETRDCRR